MGIAMADVEKFVRFNESGFGKSILIREAEYINQELKDCKKILDIGCGIGSFEEKLTELDITGLDISEEMIIEARKRSDKKFVLGNAENLEFDDSSFDGVLYVATLEFITDYGKAVQEAWRVTRPDGKLLVIMLNPESQYFLEQIEDKDSYFRKVKHANVMEIKDCIAKFYNIIKDEYFLGITGQGIIETSDKKYASLYAVVGKKIRKR